MTEANQKRFEEEFSKLLQTTKNKDEEKIKYTLQDFSKWNTYSYNIV